MGHYGTSRGIIFFLILLICLTTIVFIGTEIFQVKKITISGSGVLKEDVIIRLSGISYGDNILKLDKKRIKDRIQSSAPFPVVKAISLRIPDEVYIEVEERSPAAVIPYLSSYVVIDTEGLILDIIKQNSGSEHPVVEGIRLKSLTKGKTVEPVDKDEYKQRIMISFLKAVYDCKVQDMIGSVDIGDPDNIKLVTKDNICFTIGRAVELDRKLGWLLSEGYDEVLKKGVAGTMDVSVPGKAVFRPGQPADDPEGTPPEGNDPVEENSD